MLEGKGIRYRPGVNVSAEAFVAAAVEHHADLICCSVLLTTTMNEMGKVVAAANSGRASATRSKSWSAARR